MIAKYHGKDIPLHDIRQATYIDDTGVSIDGLQDGAEHIGLNSIPVHIEMDQLISDVPLPCILYWNKNHFVVLYEANKKKFIIADPEKGLLKLNKKEFIKSWRSGDSDTEKGYALLLEPNDSFFNTSFETKSTGFRYLTRYFKRYKKELSVVFLSMLFGLGIQVILPFLTQSIIDNGILLNDLSFIYIVLIAQIVLFISQAAVGITRSQIMLYVTRKVNISLLSDFINKIFAVSISFFDTRNKGDVMQMVNENSKLEEFISSHALDVLFNLLSVLIFSIVLFSFHFQIFLLFLFFTFGYFLWTLSFKNKLKYASLEEFNLNAENQVELLELLNSPKEIKINNSQKKRKDKYLELQERIFNASIKKLQIDLTQSTGSNVINELKNILLTFFSAKLVIQGDITLGAMLAIQYILGQLNLPLQGISVFIVLAQEARVAMERIIGVMKLDEESQNTVSTKTESIKQIGIKNLSFQYGSTNSPMVLKNITLDIPAGKTTAIVGHSGSGKTTLFNILLKFYTNYQGGISINDIKLKDLDPIQWRKNISCVNQDGYIFNDSILSNITESEQGQNIEHEKVQKAIDIANLNAVLEGLPNGLETIVGINGSKLSGGERQRILIARAVYKDSQILLLDEATSALDAKNEREIHNALMGHFKGKTVLIIAHRLSTVQNADNIVVLDGGSILEQGNHKTLINNKGPYFDLIKNQLQLSK